MRRLILVAAGLVALTTAGLAVANGIDGPKSIKSVAGTFSAASVSTRSRSCQTTDGKTIVVTNGRYAGTALGDADLAGPIRLYARSVINSDGVGVVHGKLRIDVAGADTVAHFTTVYDHGKLAGFARGHAREPYARLLGNLSASFNAASGFSDGKIGNTDGGSAVELGPGRCEPSQAKAREKSQARGTVSALSASSITVAGLTCALPADLTARVNAAFKVNDRAEIHCALVGTENTLVKIKKRR